MRTTRPNHSVKSFLSRYTGTCILLVICMQSAAFGQAGTMPEPEITRMLQPGDLQTIVQQQYYANLLADDLSPYTSGSVSWRGVALTTAALAGIYTGLFSYEQDRRWNGPRADFFFAYITSARGVDKAGHFYATKAQASMISNLYTLSNVPPRTATLLGMGIALSVQTLVELKDGHIADRGFGVYDEIANTLGAAWFYGREHSPFLQRFQVRWLYYPSDNQDLLASEHRFTEDYTGHSYWLSAKVWDLIPRWPKVIMPAVGLSLNDWVPNSDEQGYYSVHLSLNLDFDYIFTGNSPLARTFADLFNGFYIPAPAVQLYPDLGFKLIFYGQK